MGLTKVVVFIVLATLSTSSAFNTVTPWDKEVIYEWRALVNAGTFFPASFASQFVLDGKVHVQANKDSAHVKITDLTYKIYNGILDHVHEHETHSVPVPQEAEDLHHVFKVIYDSHGHAVGIVTEGEEKEFSRNIKKAIATILQIDDSVVKQPHTHAHGFVVKEHSIYGYGDEDYTVVSHHDELHVNKWHDMQTSQHLYHGFYSNVEPEHCDLGYEEVIMHDSKKKYILVANEDGHHVVKHIQSHGVIYYYPYKGKSDAQFIIVNQTFELEKFVPIENQFHIQSEHQENNLKYHVAGSLDVENIPDLTNGRHVIDYQVLIPHVQEMIKGVYHYLHQDHIHTKEPNTKEGQLINRIHRLLKYFTLEKLEELTKTLSGDDLDTFYHILPLVGTKASVLYVKQLVVKKTVHDDVAIEMLQHLPEHVAVPSVDLLTQLEELIHLDENIHWNVRRVAILSFATIINKSYKHYVKIHKFQPHQNHAGEDHHEHAEVDTHQLEQPYEKYVVEYINHIKNSKDYKVQMVYILSLSNIRFHSIIKHLMPAVNGEWFHDRNLRLLSLMAVTPSVLTDSNSDTVIETLWPIFTNRKEHTDLRITAYYFIMQSQPSHNRMKNLAAYLITEDNEELYHFHYTYVNSVIQSNEPCKQEFRVKLAQVKKFMHPPSHGLSSAHLVDYRDVNYGFSGALHSYFVNTNHSQIYSFMLNSQNVNIYHEDYGYYLKIHGIYDKDISLSNILVDTLRKKLPKVSKTQDVYIEGAIMRKGYVINTYYFDEHNLNELDLFELFTKDSQSIHSNLLHVNYHKYHRNIIPTDLGTPAVWEYFMPVVQQNNVSITKDIVNKVINIHVNNRHINWIHYRHGLTFYNPIADVWQGVNRYHSYDSVMPLNFDISINTQQQSLQISWKKEDNPQLNVAGLRSHVKQMVFVKNDFKKNILVQSCPNCKEWQVVTNGKEYRNDYTLIDEDDLNTGHKWHVGVYDSGYHVSNGTFNHLIHQFTQSYTKHYESPVGHLLASYANWEHYTLLLPGPGIYGFIVRVEPSHEHVVSNIDLSIRVHSDITTDNYPYTPASKWSTRLTYAVKNKEQSLKTWDMNAILDMNAGHTINNLKMFLTRIIPGQKDYKVCVDGVKKWTDKGVTGHLNVAMSQTPDGKCVKDDAVIDVTMTGQRSHEQNNEHHIYGACHYPIPYVIPHYHTLHCLASHTSVRHYVYNVKTTNVPTEFKKTFTHWWDHLKGDYMSYYTYQDEHNDDIGEHNLKVDVVYPMQTHEVDVHITTPNHVYSLTGVPTDYWRMFGVVPDSTVYSQRFKHQHEIGMIDHCVVHPDHHRFNHHRVTEVVPNDWTLYVADTKENPHAGVYVKHVADNKIAVKAVCHDHVVEIVPHGDSHQISLDGQTVSDQEYHYEDWVHYHVFTNDIHHPIAVMLPQSGIHFEYDGHHVVVLVPKVEQQWHGHCYSHH